MLRKACRFWCYLLSLEMSLIFLRYNFYRHKNPIGLLVGLNDVTYVKTPGM